MMPNGEALFRSLYRRLSGDEGMAPLIQRYRADEDPGAGMDAVLYARETIATEPGCVLPIVVWLATDPQRKGDLTTAYFDADESADDASVVLAWVLVNEAHADVAFGTR